jgi:hypothetical protein
MSLVDIAVRGETPTKYFNEVIVQLVQTVVTSARDM